MVFIGLLLPRSFNVASWFFAGFHRFQDGFVVFDGFSLSLVVFFFLSSSGPKYARVLPKNRESLESTSGKKSRETFMFRTCIRVVQLVTQSLARNMHDPPSRYGLASGHKFC